MDALEFSGLRRTMTAAQDYVRELHERAAEGEATAAGQLADLTNRLMVNLACLAYCGPTGGNVEQARGCIEEMSVRSPSVRPSRPGASGGIGKALDVPLK